MKRSPMRGAGILLLMLWLVVLPVTSGAAEMPKSDGGYVYDEAAMLTEATESDLESRLQAFEDETTVEIAVVTILTLSGRDIKEYSVELAQTWGIGQDKTDNGVLLLIVKNDRKVRIETGYGVEGVLPDVTAFDITENVIKPALKNGQFDQGVLDGVASIMAALKGEFASTPATTEKSAESSFPLGWIVGVVLALAVLLITAIGLSAKSSTGSISTDRRTRSYPPPPHRNTSPPRPTPRTPPTRPRRSEDDSGAGLAGGIIGGGLGSLGGDHGGGGFGGGDSGGSFGGGDFGGGGAGSDW